MAKHWLLTATLGHTSGLVENDVVASFPFESSDGITSLQVFNTTVGSVHRFFNQPNAANDSVAEFLSPSLSRTSNQIDYRLYDLTGKLGYVLDPDDGKWKVAKHGSPVQAGTGSLSVAAGGTALPDEVACVISLRGSTWAAQPVERPDGSDHDEKVDRPRQRHSGRLFVGPLAANSIDSTSGIARPSTAFRTCLLDAAERLHDDVFADQPAGGALATTWCVWSRKDGAMYPITDAQVDDAFDTQRRRGVAATIRTTRAL